MKMYNCEAIITQHLEGYTEKWTAHIEASNQDDAIEKMKERYPDCIKYYAIESLADFIDDYKINGKWMGD